MGISTIVFNGQSAGLLGDKFAAAMKELNAWRSKNSNVRIINIDLSEIRKSEGIFAGSKFKGIRVWFESSPREMKPADAGKEAKND
jgi:hypothetical protein